MTADALAELVSRHAAALVLYARQWCASTADDVVQTAFLKLVRQSPAPAHPVGWQYAVVRNAAKDASRTARRRRKHETVAAERTDTWFEPSDDPTGLDARAAAAALSELPPETREVVVAHLWGGQTFEQIAATVGGSASTVFRRYTAGIATLRETLGAPCPNPK